MDYSFINDETRDEVRSFVQSWGAWGEEEINGLTDTELNALLIQFIAGDYREHFEEGEADEFSSLYGGDNGEWFYKHWSLINMTNQPLWKSAAHWAMYRQWNTGENGSLLIKRGFTLPNWRYGGAATEEESRRIPFIVSSWSGAAPIPMAFYQTMNTTHNTPHGLRMISIGCRDFIGIEKQQLIARFVLKTPIKLAWGYIAMVDYYGAVNSRRVPSI